MGCCPAGVTGAATVLMGAGGGGMVPGCVAAWLTLAPAPSWAALAAALAAAALAVAPLLRISFVRACTWSRQSDSNCFGGTTTYGAPGTCRPTIGKEPTAVIRSSLA
jgi:hypothetical protein